MSVIDGRMIELLTDAGSFYITAEMLDAEFDRRREERKKEKRRQQNRIYYLQRKERLKQQATATATETQDGTLTEKRIVNS